MPNIHPQREQRSRETGLSKGKSKTASCLEHLSVRAKLVGFEELGAVCNVKALILVMGLVNNEGMKNSKVGKILCIECNGNRYPFSDILQRVLQQKNLDNVIFLSLLEKDMVIGRRKIVWLSAEQARSFHYSNRLFSPYFLNRPLVSKFRQKHENC